MNRFLHRRPASLGIAHLIFAFALVVRLVALGCLASSSFLLPSKGDMYFYNDWAQKILQGQLTDHQAFYGLPLYPYLLACLYKLFGYSPFVPGFLQAVLEAGTATLIYKIATRVFDFENLKPAQGVDERFLIGQNPSRIIGGLAALGWTFFVPAQAYSIILMPTSWLIFVFWFIVWEVVRTDAAPGKWRSFLYGLLIGFTAMGIATILFIVPVVLASIGWRSIKGGLTARFTAVALVFGGLGIGSSPCWLHNFLIAHDRVTLSAHSGINFWIGNNPIANGYPRFPPGLRAGQAAMLQDSIGVAEAAAGRHLKRSEVSTYWSSKAKNFIRENPGAWLKLVSLKVANFWNAFQYDDLSIVTNLREQGIILPGPRFGLIAALALPGMLLAVGRFRRSRWIVAAIFLHMASLLSVFVTERYRLAAVPGLLLFASFGTFQAWLDCSLGKLRRVALYLGALAAATLFVSMPQKNPSLWALDAYNSGWQALESHNLPLAQKKLELAQAYVPDNAEINLALGNLWVERDDPAKAEAFYRTTLSIEPRHKSALSNLGVLALQSNRADEAARLFRAALVAQPNDAKSHYLLARALFESGDRPGALAEAEMAVKRKPEQPEFRTLRDRLSSPP